MSLPTPHTVRGLTAEECQSLRMNEEDEAQLGHYTVNFKKTVAPNGLYTVEISYSALQQTAGQLGQA